MNTAALTRLVKQYLEHRRSLGHSVRRGDVLQLSQFVRFHYDEAPRKPLQAEVMLRWAVLPGTGNRNYYAMRMQRVRGFARYCATFDPRVQIPDCRLLGHGHWRVAPHIYTVEQISLLLQRARRLSTKCSPIHNLTYETFLGLIACAGLRTGEARALRCSDFDAKNRTLTIRKAKFSPERILPLHPTTVRALQHYLDVRLPLAPDKPWFFINRYHRPLSCCDISATFHRLDEGIVSTGARRPRIYDLRHTFATRHIAQWNRAGVSTASNLLLLSRYMGHQRFISTWWYVSPDAGALRRSASRFEHFFKGGKHAR
jgi:integrase